MSKKKKFLFYCLAGAMALSAPAAHAQQGDTNRQPGDSLQQQTIDIYNVFQPKLRDAAKLNINASLPALDTTRPGLVYSIPAQNLYFTYQPVPLRPLAMGMDTSYATLQNNFLKAGFGNFNTPLLQVGIGNGRNESFRYGLYFSHLSSKGPIENQAFSSDKVMVHGQYYTPTHEIHGTASFDRHGIRYYGYDHDTSSFSKSEVRQAYNTLSINAGLHNIAENILKVNYQPQIKLTNFFDIHDRRESTFYLNLPLQREIVKDISLAAGFIADLSAYRSSDSSFNNNIVSVHPAVEISKHTFKLHAGVNPTWDNAKFYLLPDIVNETDLIKDKLILSSGWISYFEKNSFEHIAGENPFIAEYPSPLNTRVEERYTGIKGTLDNHFSYNTKFAWVQYSDRPLYVNDPVYGNKFLIRNEEELKAYQLHAEIGYIVQEKFQVRLSGDWFNYFKEATEDKPWGLRPFTACLAAQYTIGNKLKLHGDAYALSGSFYRDVFGEHQKTKGAFDVNAGASYDINEQFGLWFNANNLLNSHYERWHNYPSLGLNVLGGIMIKF